MADIFITYAREDRSWAERLARALNDEGFRVWWDIDSLRLGASFAREIEQAVSRAKAGVVLWSRHSQSSEWVEAEASLAWQQVKLCSVIVETGTDVPFPFNTRHALSLASWDGSTDTPTFQRLRADLTAVAPTEERKPDPPAAPAAGSTSAERTPGGKHEAAFRSPR